ncbi:MAG: C39 family peptidase [Ilumatobacteraceae bacterium]
MNDGMTPDSYDSGVDPRGGYDAAADGHTMAYDSDGDGFAETTMVDMDGDGVADMFDVVDPMTGAEHIAFDSDGDGILDTIVSDFDGDGVFDMASMDSDGDGVLDTSFDPETGEVIDGSDDDGTNVPFIVDEESSDDPYDVDGEGDDDVHGDPMGEMEYHQAQVGPNDCLPTSVAMVLSEVLGDEVPQGDLVDLANEMGLLGPTGMSIDGGVQLLEHYGVDAEATTGTLDDLRASLDAGDDVIIGLDADDLYGQGDAPFADDLVSGHAVVITGIDDEAGVVYINDPGFPDGAGVAISIEAFEDAWQDADHSMIVVEDDGSAGDEAGTAGNANPFGDVGGDDDSSLLESITRFILMPFSLKI